ncbi:T9SS type A sorting domain-containing protein [Rhodothermus profundi]|uniref:Por secretion system C-terminal sorting domain-containing protein n=1 Tax=Rhodothermus profundi TaxID=633813 RepID=A0A1M6VUM7_9BACT|nr:T9SS type A sorting domain-containing protein [Rhodothermus profundi]SHK85252.1 Por secretion system C-terminal sorting domain-containing protein [Rhodothermus profundi]
MQRIATFMLLMLGIGLMLPARAQIKDVTVREINQIHPDSLALLKQLGANLDISRIQSLIRSPLTGDTVRFTGVVMSDPLNSGLASLNQDNVPSRLHVFVRDTAAISQGKDGMTIQIVDGSYETTGLKNLTKGDVATFTAVVTYFGHTIQLTPISIEFKGHYTTLGLPDSLLDPVVVTTADLNMNMATGKVQVNWDNFARLNNQYVRIESATILRSTLADQGRPNWLFSSDNGQTFVQADDISLRFRNDRAGYPAEYNRRDPGDPFRPPPPGALINVQGFVVFRGTFEAFDLGAVPPGAMLKLAPFEDTDLEVLESPPAISDVSRPTFVPGNAPVTVTFNVTPDPNRQLAKVELHYYTSSQPDTQIVQAAPAAAKTGQGTLALYQADIPAAPDGDFVVYWIEAEDNTGARVRSDDQYYRVLYNGITQVAHVQETPTGGPGGSPFVGVTTDMNLNVVVQSQPAISGMVAVQDDANLGPWSGILLNLPSTVRDTLQRGDRLHITRAHIRERFGVTELDSVVFTKTSTGDFLGYKLMTTNDLVDPAIAEAHEGMLVRFENVTIINPDEGYGEWSFSSDGTAENKVKADDRSAAIPRDFAASTFQAGDQLAFIQGIWWYSFGEYKLVPEDPATDIGTITDVDPGEALPATFALAPNYPNPFADVTTLRYTLPQTGPVRLEVFDLLGRRVAVVVDGVQPAGMHEVKLDGRHLSNGLYVVRLTTEAGTATRMIVRMK